MSSIFSILQQCSSMGAWGHLTHEMLQLPKFLIGLATIQLLDPSKLVGSILSYGRSDFHLIERAFSFLFQGRFKRF